MRDDSISFQDSDEDALSFEPNGGDKVLVVAKDASNGNKVAVLLETVQVLALKDWASQYVSTQIGQANPEYIRRYDSDN